MNVFLGKGVPLFHVIAPIAKSPEKTSKLETKPATYDAVSDLVVTPFPRRPEIQDQQIWVLRVGDDCL